MNPTIELNLALILFLPWFAILGVLFWVYPRGPRSRARNVFDAGSLLLALLAATLGTWWGFHNADMSIGPLWRQVLASTMSYGLFLGVMVLAVWLRHRWLSHRTAP